MKVILILIIMVFTACASVKDPEVEKKSADIIRNQPIDLPVVTETEVTLGEAVTDIIDRGKNRVSNINLAIAKISGTKLMPGEEFSFNNITGRKTEANGYKYAPVIIDGEKDYGIGGGVCQVSTTVYQAALNAGMEITEHHNHSEPVAYAPEGKDATVAFGFKDFIFKNNTEETVYVYTWVENEKVFAKLVKKVITVQ